MIQMHSHYLLNIPLTRQKRIQKRSFYVAPIGLNLRTFLRATDNDAFGKARYLRATNALLSVYGNPANINLQPTTNQCHSLSRVPTQKREWKAVYLRLWKRGHSPCFKCDRSLKTDVCFKRAHFLLTPAKLELDSRLSITRRAKRRVHEPNLPIILRISSPNITLRDERERTKKKKRKAPSAIESQKRSA